MATHRQASQTRASRISNEEEEEMRVIDCPCGHQLQAADDEELYQRCREHIAEHHPEMERTDEQIRQRVAGDAHEVEAVR